MKMNIGNLNVFVRTTSNYQNINLNCGAKINFKIYMQNNHVFYIKM